MREKKYGLPEQSKRKVNYRHLGMLIAAAAVAIALIIAAIFIVIHIVSGDPFPEDVSLTKEAGSVQTEIDDKAALKLRYPSFADEQLDQAVQEKVKQLREAADGEDTVIDYRSKTVFDTYTSVLFKVTKADSRKRWASRTCCAIGLNRICLMAGRRMRSAPWS